MGWCHETVRPGHGISASSWDRLERCPREWRYTYIDKIKPLVEDEAPQIGTAVHRGLAAYYENGRDTAKALTACGHGPEPAVHQATARNLVDAYIRHWSDQADFKVVAIEHYQHKSFADRSRHFSVSFGTRPDLVIEDDGRKIVVDHKTAGRDSGDFLLEWKNSMQFVGAAAVTGIRSVMLNRIVKTRIPKFDRQTFFVDDSQIAKWKRDLLLLDKDRRRYMRTGYFPRRRSACIQRYKVCPFYHLCHERDPSGCEVPASVDIAEATA